MAENLTKTREYLARIKENLLNSKIEPFQFPRANIEPKQKTQASAIPVQDPIMLLSLRLIN
jgi:hypothetical protein